mmetsp:Transcript_10649/g.7956  ORF Transcript_10649/g.7956 Transcript_10649/m.7956 type:complete len:96 (+) Transcript_10649:646-933(+)
MENIEGFMIECFQCEDWFHNNHLTPKLESQIDEKFILICKNCTAKLFKEKIMAYKEYFHESLSDYLCLKENLEPSKKRICTDKEDEASSPQKLSC